MLCAMQLPAALETPEEEIFFPNLWLVGATAAYTAAMPGCHFCGLYGILIIILGGPGSHFIYNGSKSVSINPVTIPECLYYPPNDFLKSYAE